MHPPLPGGGRRDTSRVPDAVQEQRGGDQEGEKRWGG
jgi:hypothetical protein